MAKTALESSPKDWREYRLSEVLKEREKRESKVMAKKRQA